MQQAITTLNAPQAIGPYSQAVKVGDLLYVSGQIPIDPTTQQIVVGDIAAQTQQVMYNLKAILEAAGTDFVHVVKTTIYLTDLAQFGQVNEIYGAVFTEPYPARATVQVAALPKGVSIEIECVVNLE